MALFITQCPHCNTSFRTRISQLQSADGMVRCGACLKIFVADDNLVPSPDLQTVTVEVVNLESTSNIEPQMAFEDSMEDSFNADESPGIDDEIITLDLADSLPNRITPSISEHEPLWELLDEDDEHGRESPTDIEKEERHVISEHQTTTIENPIERSLKPVLDDIEDLPEHDDFRAENLTAMHDFADPLELDWHQPQQRQLRSTIGMWALAIVMTAALGAQFIWYQRESLSQNTTFRPWLAGACNILTCTLPPIVDIRTISSDNLLIRSHTTIANALSVNLVVRNNASFPQPFPTLNLRFTTAVDELVAARQFTPEEYVTPDILALGMMPAGAPVQIAMDILDPGSAAINYEVSFSPMLSQPTR